VSDEPLEAVPTVIDAEEALELRAIARTIHVSEDVERYIVALVRATREHADVRLGASPRGSVALYRVAQASALLDGRGFVLPDDVRTVAHAVLDHRLLLEVDRELRGATVTGVVQEVIDSVPVPLAGDFGEAE
jgi:MoxR-like ATPase